MRVCLWSGGGRTDALTRLAATQDNSTCPTSYGPLCRTQHFPSYGVQFPRQTNLSLPASTPTTRNSLRISATRKPSPESLSPDEEAAYQEFLQKRAAERKAWKQEMRRRANFDPMASPTSQPTTPSSSPSGPRNLSGAGSPAVPMPALTRPKPPLSPSPSTNITTPSAAAKLRPTTPTSNALPVRNNAVAASNAGTTVLRPPSKPLGVQGPDARNILDGGKAKHQKVKREEEDEEDELDLDAMAAMARRIMQEDDNSDDDEEEEEQEDPDRTPLRSPAASHRPVMGRSDSNSRSSTTPTPNTPTSSSGRGVVGGANSVGTRTAGVVTPAPKRRLMPIAQLQRQRAAEAAKQATSTSGRDGPAAAAAAAVGGIRRPPGAAAASAAAAAAAALGSSSRRGSLLQQQRQPTQPQEEDDDDDDEEGQAVLEDLDWEALQAYEKYEQYVNEIAAADTPGRNRPATSQSEKAIQPILRPTPGGGGSSSVSGRSLLGGASNLTGATTATTAAVKTIPGGATDVKPPVANALASSNSSSSNKTSSNSSGSSSRTSVAGVSGSGRLASFFGGDDDDDDDDDINDPASRLEMQLDKWEQLVKVFELAEREGKREEARQRRSKAAAEAGDDAVEVEEEEVEEEANEEDLDWQSLEQLFLGEKWDTELEDFRTHMETGVAKAEAVMLASEAAEGEEGPEGAVGEPWKDELSTLLVGLVDISARHYLGRNLLAPQSAAPTSQPAAAGALVSSGTAAAGEKTAAADGGSGTTTTGSSATDGTPSSGSGQGASPRAVAPAPQQQALGQLGEEERAEAYWRAPFLLLVQDDSPDPVLEYVNSAALSALRLGSFHDATAGIPSATLVDERHEASQSEWIWAVSEAMERPEGYVNIPSLRLHGPGPDAPTILATDVVVFQVDSLQGEPIGQAVVATHWQILGKE